MIMGSGQHTSTEAFHFSIPTISSKVIRRLHGWFIFDLTETVV
jgi:hypothetical protein